MNAPTVARVDDGGRPPLRARAWKSGADVWFAHDCTGAAGGLGRVVGTVSKPKTRTDTEDPARVWLVWTCAACGCEGMTVVDGAVPA